MAADDTAPAKPKLVEKLEARRETHKEHSRIVRALYVLVGVTLTLGGIAMLVLPGPAFVVIPIGLAILSLEFTWAQNALDKSIEQAEKAKQKAADASRTERILTAVATALGIAAVAAWAYWGDIPVLPV